MDLLKPNQVFIAVNVKAKQLEIYYVDDSGHFQRLDITFEEIRGCDENLDSTIKFYFCGDATLEMYPYGNHCHVSHVDLKLEDKGSTVKHWQVCYLDKKGHIGPSQVNGGKAYLDLVGLKTNPVVFLEFDQENISPLSEYEITRSYYGVV